MSNQYDSKRSFSSENENSSSKKNKTPESIELSDDETNDNDEIGELQIKRSHYRKNIGSVHIHGWNLKKRILIFIIILFFLCNKLIKLICFVKINCVIKFKLCANYNVTR